MVTQGDQIIVTLINEPQLSKENLDHHNEGLLGGLPHQLAEPHLGTHGKAGLHHLTDSLIREVLPAGAAKAGLEHPQDLHQDHLIADGVRALKFTVCDGHGNGDHGGAHIPK